MQSFTSAHLKPCIILKHMRRFQVHLACSHILLCGKCRNWWEPEFHFSPPCSPSPLFSPSLFHHISHFLLLFHPSSLPSIHLVHIPSSRPPLFTLSPSPPLPLPVPFLSGTLWPTVNVHPDDVGPRQCGWQRVATQDARSS